MTVQLLLLSLLVLTDRATRAASVKASFTPLFFIAEHSATGISWAQLGRECGGVTYRGTAGL